ncbi:hypothetical protein O181_087464 [Austropuccinia psidii MF-1]|uniref:Retroviral polymerase SH3-like domain-containing protein n=1 Tax=Austropuccinia psidii MF-1 TaxID=1389203 RepID=A0A9Q3IPU4_9BASI|nr:hypothetical protein [Austropuccinia psidii MF-1]
MARSMILESPMPNRFGQFAYALACFMHNCFPNSQCPKFSPHEHLFGHPPSISTLYPFGTDTIVHVPTVQQPHKLAPRGVVCRLLKLLISVGWLLWEPTSDKMIHSTSVIFARFQPLGVSNTDNLKGSLAHIVNGKTLRNVPMEQYFGNKNTAIDTLPLTKDIAIPEYLGQALSG